ncbi:radical SAM/SPASM domain-containing protein [Lacrimispora amygdalina]|uniref:radical SAM/SPASM domain-containing protein n=1 Tax=Lacrimispora amygdalina TaxID=253257 RepID=UPI000BE25F0D|nr:radical SAM protein [Lacrimispora amygdalina]
MKSNCNIKIEYEKIEVLGKTFIWLPESMILFQSSDLIEDLLEKYNKENEEEILAQYPDDKKGYIQKLFQQFSWMDKENQKYKSIIYNSEQVSDIAINSVELNPAYACNLRCRYCFAGDGGHFKNGVMDLKMAEKAVDFLFKEAKDKDTVYIAFIGGEPLVNLSMILHVLEYSTEMGKRYNKEVRFATTTNGTLLTSEVMQLLNQYDVQSMISVDSPDPKVHNFLRPLASGEGSFDIVKDNGWKNMLQSERKKAVRATVTPYNMNVFDMAKDFYEEGFEHVHMEEVTDADKQFEFTEEQLITLKGEYDKLAVYLAEEIGNGKNLDSKPLLSRIYEIHNRKPRYNYCGAFQNSVGISPEGEIFPCDWMMRDEYKIGDLDTGIDYDKYKKLSEQIPIPEKCSTCWARNICGSGCRIKHKGAYDKGEEINCDLDLHKYKLQLYLYYEIMQKRPDFFQKYEKEKWRVKE